MQPIYVVFSGKIWLGIFQTLSLADFVDAENAESDYPGRKLPRTVTQSPNLNPR